jgi:blue copper oxidase
MKIKIIKSLPMAFCFAIANVALGQNPLMIPPAINGPVFNLNVQQDSTEFYSGHQTPTYGVNGNILGPTLIFNKWDTVTLNVTNNLPVATTMHWHGMHVPAIYDGGPHQVIASGATWSPSYRVMNDAATYWYHPHGQAKTDLQVSKGIAGLIIVRDSTEAGITLPRTYGVDDFPIIIQSKAFDILYQVAIATALDTLTMVNATVNPYLDAPAQVVRLRCLNGSSERSYLIGFSNNMSFYEIATDGGLRDTSLVMTSLLLSPGERAEILVDLSGMQGQSINLMNFGTLIQSGVIGAANVGIGMATIPDYNLNPRNGADYPLLQINVVGQTANPVVTIPSALVAQNPWNVASANYTRQFSLTPANANAQTMVEGPFNINGNMFSMSVINDTVYLNNIEIWTIINQTLIAHPFHVHDVQFYVTDINGLAPPAYMQGKKDVVLVNQQETVSFITKFEDYTDAMMPYMYHCHLLHHEDDGMMGSFIVLDSSTTGINNVDYFSGNLYPNPVESGDLHVTNLKNAKGDYTITDVTGKIVLTGSKRNGEDFAISVSSLPGGSYFIQFFSNNGNACFKFIKE